MALGIVFFQIVMKLNKSWWDRYIYDVSNGLDIGAAFQVVLTSMCQQFTGIYGINWWGLDVGDHCPLAQCPYVSAIYLFN